MRKFYELFVNQNWNTMCSNLTWSHYREVLSLENINKITYYLNICEEQNLSVRELRQKIKSDEYERLDEETKKKLKIKEKLKVPDLVKNPIQIKNKVEYNEISEKILQKLILEDIPFFLKELGNGFTFARKKIDM